MTEKPTFSKVPKRKPATAKEALVVDEQGRVIDVEAEQKAAAAKAKAGLEAAAAKRRAQVYAEARAYRDALHKAFLEEASKIAEAARAKEDEEERARKASKEKQSRLLVYVLAAAAGIWAASGLSSLLGKQSTATVMPQGSHSMKQSKELDAAKEKFKDVRVITKENRK